MPSFDLTSRPWLPVQLTSGEPAVLSLRDVFARAHEVRRLAGDLATQDFALTRLLLAIVHDALDGPRSVAAWAGLWADSRPFTVVDGYLLRHRERFDLLHPRTPFFQTPGLRTASGEVFSLNRIVADVPNGAPFFTTRLPGAERLSFAEAARWVVHAQAYDTSGIKSGVVGDPRAKGGRAYPQGVAWAGNLGAVLVEGDTLRETLLLNLVADDDQPATGAEDRPAWRRPPTAPGAADDLAARPAGPCDLYTWQSRRLLLHADADGVHGVVLTYGDPLAARNMQHVEPMTAWRRSRAQEKKLGLPLVYLPREHDPARAAWRSLEALITPAGPDTTRRGEPAGGLRPGVVDWIARLRGERILPRDRRIRLRTFGVVYGTQQSVIDEVTGDAVSLAVPLLDDDQALARTAVDAIADADRAVLALGDLVLDLARAAGSASESGTYAARDAAYAALDGPYRLWLDAIGEGGDPRCLRAAWQHTVRYIVGRLADEVLEAAGEAAWRGRVVSRAQGETWLNADLADLWFRARLHRALVTASDATANATATVPAPREPASDVAVGPRAASGSRKAPV
ncbi:type I-E CRISPR-associated protein Cse1/CasA [Actinacidiphila sp. bgisy167]|uniref:type I-E CRISPR-associated protein Cse1/CasA n=1 Tax=Actinacidiphila sp. bgisy167 TaxID=3413797 RepID=UPI003D714AD8